MDITWHEGQVNINGGYRGTGLYVTAGGQKGILIPDPYTFKPALLMQGVVLLSAGIGFDNLGSAIAAPYVAQAGDPRYSVEFLEGVTVHPSLAQTLLKLEGIWQYYLEHPEQIGVPIHPDFVEFFPCTEVADYLPLF